MIPYVLQVTVILTVCFLFYKLVLQKATFYGLNRWTLLGCLVLSFVLPMLPAPRGWTLNAADTTASPAATTAAAPIAVADRPLALRSEQATAASRTPVLATPPEHPAHTAKDHTPVEKPDIALKLPVVSGPDAASKSQVASKSQAASNPGVGPKPDGATALTSSSPSHPFSAFLLKGLRFLVLVYLSGLVIFGIKFALQIIVLCIRSFACPVVRDGRYRIVQTDDDRGPCTFANTIFINPALYDPETYSQILVHEKVHVSGGHTLDILLAELAVVFQWFNPFAWMYGREIENNLEFLTDRSVLEHPYIEPLAYQLSLLRVSARHLPFSITNNYNQSLLKRRIVMMNSQLTKRHTIWKYAGLLPIFLLLVCLLNKPVALGQTIHTRSGQLHVATTGTQPTIIAASPADTGIRPSKTAKVAATITGTIASTSNTGAVTAISGTVSSIQEMPILEPLTPLNATTLTTVTPMTVAKTEPVLAVNTTPVEQFAPAIPDTSFPHFSDNMELRQGSWFLTVDSDNMDFLLRAQSGDNSWESSFTVKKNEINPYPGQGTVEFKLVREAGTMTFKGSFDGMQGLGHFQFQPDESYFNELQKMGVEDLEEGRRQGFFLRNITKDFVRMLIRNGYTPITQRDVFSLSIRKVDEPFIKYWKNSGVEGTDQVHNLIMLNMMHIEPDYVDDLKKAGYTHLTVQQLIKLKRQHIDGNYIRSMSAGGTSPVPPEELVSYKMMQIDSGYLNSLKKVGYDHLDRSEIRSLSSSHVTAEYIKGFQDAGFSNIPARTLVMLKYENVTPDLAKTFRDLGYSDIELNRLATLQRAGITSDFITAFHKMGYDNIPLNLLYSLKSAGVDADYVKKMKEKGFNSNDLNKYVRLKRDFN
ncbi:MAG TPA: M56 family metallopeptidase [Puia sp.]|nr:M56 family metallopeptidase [Puia sp.]